MSGMQQRSRPQPPAPAPVPQKHVPAAQMNDEMDAVGEMELDEPVGRMEIDDNQQTAQQNRQMFGQQRPQLHLNSSGLSHPALRTSAPTTPAGANFNFGNNPTVSSVNTPTLTTQHGFGQRPQFSQDMTPIAGNADMDLSGLPNMSNLTFGTNQWGMGFGADLTGVNLNTTIDDPARRLFSPNGSQLTPQQQALRLAQSSGLDTSQLPPGADTAALLQQINASLMIPEEPKPYKCPVVGCEKAYKNQNGLKYVPSPSLPLCLC